ncbi:sensor histidine kinase [Pedobacter sp. 22226]|uniref:sensor histidine kinase n=1 Tax=Pedobacter sp. 22226 TaxID=3453894 RepID=UPI003F879B76
MKEVITPAVLEVLPNYIMAVMKHFTILLSRYKIHFLSWALFISAETGIIGLATGVFGDAKSYIYHYIQNIGLFYLCALWLYHRIFQVRNNWIWKLPTFLGAVYFFYLFTSYGIDTYLLKETTWYSYHKISIGKPYIFNQLWRSLIFMGAAGFYYLFLVHLKEIEVRKKTETEYYQSILSERELQIELANAKNSYLKAQINPHLLFNVLNFIYQDVYGKLPKSAEAVMQLSDIMRYSINCEFSEQTVPLKDELEQIDRLIILHQTRFENDICINFTYPAELVSKNFIPLVLVTLVENIFKHGIFQDPENPANLDIGLINDQIVITSRNLLNRKKTSQSMNKGLDNIRQRLKLIYGSKASMEYSTSEGIFDVRIIAPLLD